MRKGGKEVVELAERYGFRHEGFTGLNHLLFRHPCGIKIVGPSKVNDPRTLKNFEAELRHKLRSKGV